MKKSISLLLLSAMLLSVLGGCGAKPTAPAENEFDKTMPITVVSREDGSGTRGAFIELFHIEEKGADGTKTDHTTKETTIAPKTDVMLTNVSGDPYAIGYVSLGSLNSSVKAVPIDGAQASADNVKNGSYKISRPFNIATKGAPSELAGDFIGYIMSAEGQEIVQKSGYIKVDETAGAYAGTKPAGKLVIAGSSSVSPVMEKLREGYLAINSGATVEIQTSDSTAGMTAAIEGTCEIGMASRELKDSESAQLKATAIANDGIAVITAAGNPVSGLTGEQVKEIFTGKTTEWSSLLG